MRSKTLALKNVEKRAFAVLTLLLMVLGVLYGYLISTSIVNVIVREEAEEEIAVLGSELSELELTYISRKNTIDQGRAQALGYTKLSHKEFVTRRGASGRGLTLSDNNEI